MILLISIFFFFLRALGQGPLSGRNLEAIRVSVMFFLRALYVVARFPRLLGIFELTRRVFLFVSSKDTDQFLPRSPTARGSSCNVRDRASHDTASVLSVTAVLLCVALWSGFPM